MQQLKERELVLIVSGNPKVASVLKPVKFVEPRSIELGIIDLQMSTHTTTTERPGPKLKVPFTASLQTVLSTSGRALDAQPRPTFSLTCVRLVAAS